jgi:hypothetical protein
MPASNGATNQGAKVPISEKDLDQLFRYHPPKPEQLQRYEAVNQAAKSFAKVILENTPLSADQSDAIRKVREARMTANAAIALEGKL